MSFSHIAPTARPYSREWLAESGLEQDPEEAPHVVTYPGFLQPVSRTFPNRERAEQWARQVGVFTRATIKPA